MDTVYVETSIVMHSHATAWPSKDPVIAVLQQQAKRWWNEQRKNYRLVTSQFVIDEAADGDAEAARLRLEMLDGMLRSERVEQIAEELIRRSLVAGKGQTRWFAYRIGGRGWCTPSVDSELQAHRERSFAAAYYDLLEEYGLPRLLICTPAEFLGGPNGVG